jgi:methionyl-tRNA formyltransferase
VAMFAEGAVPREAQSHLPGSYFPRRGPGDEWIDWQDSSRNIYNKIRGICRPAPGARTWFAETEIVLWRALYDPDWPEYIATPGQVVGIEPGGGLRVKTGDSTIVLEEWESTGDSPLPRIRIGQRFGINLAQRMVELSTELATLRASKK